MYEATCPNCGHVAKASFIRVGAVMVCEGCRQRFQVQPGKVVRKFETVSDAALAEFTDTSAPSPGAGAGAGATGPAKPAPSEPRSGGWTPPGSDLERKAPSKPASSSAPSAAPRPQSRRTPSATAPAAPAQPTPSSPSTRARKRRPLSWSTIYALGASLTVTVVLIFALIIAAMDDGTGRPPSQALNGAATTDPAVPLDPAIPLLPVEAFAPAPWQPADEEATTLTPTLGPIKIQDESWVRPAGVHDRLLYAAKAATDGDAIGRATLSLAMIDDEGRIYARTTVVLLNVNSHTPAPIAVPTPSELRDRMALMLWEVRVDEPCPGAVAIDDTRIQAFSSGPRTVVRVKAFNPLAAPMKDMAFAIRGKDAQGQPLGPWRVRCTDVLGPKRSVEFSALIDVPAANVAWTVSGAGTPVADPSPSP